MRPRDLLDPLGQRKLDPMEAESSGGDGGGGEGMEGRKYLEAFFCLPWRQSSPGPLGTDSTCSLVGLFEASPR